MRTNFFAGISGVKRLMTWNPTAFGGYMKPVVRIENWMVIKHPNGLPYNVLTGSVEGHPRLGTEPWIYTSKILKLDPEKDYCETENTVYVLGAPRRSHESDPRV